MLLFGDISHRSSMRDSLKKSRPLSRKIYTLAGELLECECGSSYMAVVVLIHSAGDGHAAPRLPSATRDAQRILTKCRLQERQIRRINEHNKEKAHRNDCLSAGASTAVKPSVSLQTGQASGWIRLRVGVSKSVKSRSAAQCGQAGLIDDKRIVWKLFGKAD